MASMTSYLQKKFLDHFFGIAVFTPPTTIYLALHVGNPTKAGSHAFEVAGAGYTRLAITGNISATDLTTGRSLNTAVLNVGPAVADWGTVTYASFEDSPTPGSGNMLMFQPLDQAETIGVGNQFQLTPGQMAVSAS